VLILASGLYAADAPPNLMKKVAAKETEAARAQSNYTYRQTVLLEELDSHGGLAGQWRDVRDIIFSPTEARTEHIVGKPLMTLRNLQLTEEDFRDIREIQPFLLTTDQAFIYESKYRGEETMDGIQCFVLEIRPRQILDGQRLFEGLLWIDQHDFSIIRSEGQAVPQIRTTKQENLFPHFTTIRRKVPGDFWFPVKTIADDTLYFRAGAQRERLTISYTEYKKFGSDTTITFEK
jgi:hypothetical protein